MTTPTGNAPDTAPDERTPSDTGERHAALAATTTAPPRPASPPTRRATLAAFWTKMTNDWIFNLAGLLAYNFLMSMFPFLVLLLAAAGYFLPTISPVMMADVQRGVARLLPPPTGTTLVNTIATHLRESAGWLLLVGVLTSIVTGSRLFITLESCFGIIFRLRARHPLLQNLMALSMLTLYVVLVPLLVLVSIVPTAIVGSLDPQGRNPLEEIAIGVGGGLVALLAALLLFGITYFVVPNRAYHKRTIWRGALVAAVLLVVYELIFPLYQRFLLRPGNYGSVAGFAVVILLFFYYLAFILLLGAEINSWHLGQRETAADLPGILHAVQAHRSTRGAAGPTAGQPQEELQRHTRRDWFRRRHRRRD
jgi:YihY family inner membrane protein